jgi:hypothetical protein
LLRRLRLLAHPPVSRVDALAIVQQECEIRGWRWVEPVIVREGLRSWRIWTAADMRGGNILVVVDGRTGAVRRATVAER